MFVRACLLLGLAALCIAQPEEVLERVAVVRSLLVLREEARDRAKEGRHHAAATCDCERSRAGPQWSNHQPR